MLVTAVTAALVLIQVMLVLAVVVVAVVQPHLQALVLVVAVV